MNNGISPKRMGFCSLCDDSVREVKVEWVGGDRDGEPREFGGPERGSHRTSVVLRGGSRMDFTLCARCRLTPDNVVFVWKRMLVATAREISPEWRRKYELPMHTEKQASAAQRFLRNLMSDPPLGILGRQLWTELENG